MADNGTTADGTPITPELIKKLADLAEAGYDVEAMLRRRKLATEGRS